jgi:hypothetical protein
MFHRNKCRQSVKKKLLQYCRGGTRNGAEVTDIPAAECLKMETSMFFRNIAMFYQTIWHHVPEDG